MQRTSLFQHWHFHAMLLFYNTLLLSFIAVAVMLDKSQVPSAKESRLNNGANVYCPAAKHRQGESLEHSAQV